MKPVDARYDVLERRVLARIEYTNAEGTYPDWVAVEVTQPVEGIWTTFLYSGYQGFEIARSNKENKNGEQHCMFMGRMLVTALRNAGLRWSGE